MAKQVGIMLCVLALLTACLSVDHLQYDNRQESLFLNKKTRAFTRVLGVLIKGNINALKGNRPRQQSFPS